jgi:hypothetical protein
MTVYTTMAIATNAIGNTITVASAANMIPGLPIVFSGNVFGNIIANATYYIGNITYDYPTSQITLNTMPGAGPYAVTTGSGDMTATFSAGGQQIIPIESPGIPLNTAFNYINLNFDQIWAAGPVGSNIQIDQNTIYTLDTNGNLTLNPNGIGNVMANASVNPAQDRVWSLGAPNLRWESIYVEYGNIANVDLESITIPVGNFYLLGGNNGDILTTNGSGNLSWIEQEAKAGGNNSQIQYNDNTVLNGSNTFTFNANTQTVTLENLVTTGRANLNSVSNLTITGGSVGYVLQTDGTGNLTWTSPTGNLFTIEDQQITGDGINTSYTLIKPTTDYAVIVAINGVQQLPGSAYTVLGDQIVFSEPLRTSEIADVRFLIGGPAANGEPGGSNGTVQFNNGAGLGGSANLIYNQLTGNLFSSNISVSGNVTASYYYGDGGLLSNVTACADTGNITFSNNIISTNDPGNLIAVSAPQSTTVTIATGGNTAVSQVLWATNIGALTPDQLNNGVVTGNTWGTQISAGNTGATIASNSVAGLKAWTFGTDGTFSAAGNIISAKIEATDILANGTITSDANITATGNITGTYIFGNGSQLTGLPEAYGNSNVANYLNGSIGNVIPIANISYSLGNATNQWLDLWVSNNTIYLNSIPVTLTAGNTLTVNGNPLVTVNNNAVANIGNFVFNGNALQNPNGGSFNNGSLTQEVTAGLTVPVNGSGTAQLFNTYGSITVTTGIDPGNTQAWTFETNGDISLPGNGLLGNPYNDIPNVAGLQAGTNAYAVLCSNDLDQFVQTDANAVYIGTNFSGNVLTWAFDKTGNLTLPGNTVYINYANGQPYGGSGSNTIPGGNTTEIQFNNSNVFTGSANLTFDSGNSELYVGGSISAAGNITGNYFIGDGSQLTGITVSANTGNITFNNSTIVGPSFGVVPSASSSVFIQPTVDSANIFQFTGTGNLVLPGNTFSVNYANGIPVSLEGSYGNANVATFLAAFGSNTITTTGNVTGGNLISSATIFGNVDVVLGNIANASATRTRMVTDTTFSYIQTGNGTIGSTGNIVFSPYSSPTQQVVIDTASGNLSAAGNVTAQNFIGNISITGNVTGTSANVDLVAGSYEWSFDNTGNLTLPGNTFSVNYANNTPVDIITRFEGSWNVATGNSTVSFTVDPNESYQMWVEGNIPNGIIVWNATATVTNTNVPVVGAQYAWVYDGGGTPIDFTSIPNQFIGTSNTIVRSSVAPSTTTNRFDFGINNTSGSPQTVRYGWIKVS